MAKDADPKADAPLDAPVADGEAVDLETPRPRSKKALVIAGAAVAVLAAGGGGAFFMMKGGSKPADPAAAAAEVQAPAAEAAPAEAATGAPKANTNYISLTPSFVVNLTDDEAMRYLQIEIDVATSEASTADAVKMHMPVIRNNLLMLMGQKRYHELDSREGKEALRAEALAEVQKILAEQTGKTGVEALYFTSFVMQ